MLTLDPKQLEAKERAIEYCLAPQGSHLTIGGYAGTGKTTVASSIITELTSRGLPCKPCAFTGKAAHILRKKGITSAETIHRSIYYYDSQKDTFILKKEPNCAYFLVDEGSMVGVSIWDDLQSFGLPIIVVGDHGQLKPLGEDARLMVQLDVELGTIHRHEGTIPWFANVIRMTGDIPKVNTPEVSVRPKGEFMRDLPGLLTEKYHFLCGLNRTRVHMNKEIMRRLNDHRREPLLIGEKLIVLHNDRRLGVFNGMFLEVITTPFDHGTYSVANVRRDDGSYIMEAKLWHGHLDAEASIDWRRYPKGQIICDYGYCTTVHKFQGSEDDNVCVIDESTAFSGAESRWLYTACTRASEQLRVYT